MSENYSVRVSSARQKEDIERQARRGRHGGSSIFNATSGAFTNYGSDVNTTPPRRLCQDLDYFSSSPSFARSDYTITAALLPNWEDRSVNLFFRNFTLAGNKNGSPGYFAFLPEMYQASQIGSGLSLAIQAASYAAMANRSNLFWLEEKARSMYGQALTSVNQLLRRSEEATKDDTIVAVLLLVVFEVSG